LSIETVFLRVSLGEDWDPVTRGAKKHNG
jgi:hypothetical protein